MGRRSRPPRFILRPDGVVVKRDTTEHEAFLCVHGETRGGAYIVSREGWRPQAVTVPKCFLDIIDYCGGFRRLNHLNHPEIVPLALVSGPGFIFDEKGLR